MTGFEPSDDSVASMLGVLGVGSLAPDHAALCKLQRAWTLTQPFHNLDLLAGFATGAGPLDREQGWERCLQALGGPCHVMASSFLALLEGVGFQAHLAAATISNPGDHLVVCAHVDGRSYICDVGNGHPYVAPFPFDEPATQRHLGWEVRTTPTGRALLVEQRTPGAADWRRVYQVTPTPREWQDCRSAIQQHHRDAAFGPFLRGLRAVRIADNHAYTLRDDVLTRHTADAVETQVLTDGHEQALRGQLGLEGLPIDQAVRTWRSNTGRLR